jgi:undecaprenyl-diphosphatase
VNLDETLVLAINHHLAGRWPALDALAAVVADSELVKGAVFVAALWYLWFRQGERDTEGRAHVLGVLAGAFVAVVLTRALALLLPFRARPYALLGPAFIMPGGILPESMERWSSFPSDHAALFFAFAAGIAARARGLGLVAAVYAAAVIAWPRLYLGLHWASDLVVGALVGAVTAALVTRWAPVRRGCQALLARGERNPGVFYAVLFLVMFEVATVFDSVRAFGRLALTTVATTGAGGEAIEVGAAVGAGAALVLLALVLVRRRPLAAATSVRGPAAAAGDRFTALLREVALTAGQHGQPLPEAHDVDGHAAAQAESQDGELELLRAQ